MSQFDHDAVKGVDEDGDDIVDDDLEQADAAQVSETAAEVLSSEQE
jgi:hypothetical protein